jgi:uncharacterized protein
LRQYLDTSVVVSFVVREVHTSVVREWLSASDGTRPVVSNWTIAEFQSALSLKLRTGQISMEVKADAQRFISIAADTLFDVVNLTSADFTRAARLAAQPELWLRAGDALNLAVAERNCDAIFTLDRKLHQAAAAIGMGSLGPD